MTTRRQFLQAATGSPLLMWLAGSMHASADTTVTPPVIAPYLLQMIRDDAIHRELHLNPKQIEQVYAAIGSVDPRWWKSRIQSKETQDAEIHELTLMLRDSLAKILTADQRDRLLQLERQAHGTRAILRPDVVSALRINDVQAKKLTEQFAITDRDVAEIQNKIKEQSIAPEDAAQRIQKIKDAEHKFLATTLTETQRAEIGPLVGPTFNFSAVKRTYPRGPELITTDSTWVGGEGTTLAECEGQVVAIHFYAFQCINCQRNFPHYISWDADLRNRGLKVIGIQTPETSAERDLARVTAAAKSDLFDFPVLFDEKSSNWQAWGNTMWPTVYLLDKKGFVRRWWQGEMNWQETLGEQQMRGTIMELIEET